jgi:hypothetical protein
MAAKKIEHMDVDVPDSLCSSIAAIKLNSSEFSTITVTAVIQGHGGILTEIHPITGRPVPVTYKGRNFKYIGQKYSGFPFWMDININNHIVQSTEEYMNQIFAGNEMNITELFDYINQQYVKYYSDTLQAISGRTGAYAYTENIDTKHLMVIPTLDDPNMFGINMKYDDNYAEKIFTGIAADEFFKGTRPAIFSDVLGKVHTAGPIVTLYIIFNDKILGNIPVTYPMYISGAPKLTDIVNTIYSQIPEIIRQKYRKLVSYDPSVVELNIVDLTCATEYHPTHRVFSDKGTLSAIAGQFPNDQFHDTVHAIYATMPQIQNWDELQRIMCGKADRGGKNPRQTKRRRHKSRAARRQKGGYKKIRSIRKHKSRLVH